VVMAISCNGQAPSPLATTPVSRATTPSLSIAAEYKQAKKLEKLLAKLEGVMGKEVEGKGRMKELERDDQFEVQIYLFISLYIYMCGCIYVCMYMHIYTYVCICMCMYVYI